MPVYVMGILVSMVILLIQDLDRPATGYITVSQQPMLDTAASIEASADYLSLPSVRLRARIARLSEPTRMLVRRSRSSCAGLWRPVTPPSGGG